MSRQLGTVIVLAAVLSVAPLAAEAAVVYDFTVVGAEDFGGGGRWTGGFILETPTFITPTQSFAPTDLASCSAFLAGVPHECRTQYFYEAGTYGAGLETVGFGVDTGSTYFFYFPAGTFGTVGNHDSELLDGVNDAALTVRQVNDPGPPQIPEPATVALLAGGLAGLGLARRRRP